MTTDKCILVQALRSVGEMHDIRNNQNNTTELSFINTKEYHDEPFDIDSGLSVAVFRTDHNCPSNGFIRFAIYKRSYGYLFAGMDTIEDYTYTTRDDKINIIQ